MADFYAPQFQNPEILRSAAMGQEMGQEQALAPYRVAGAQQQVQTGQLNLDMLRQMMGMKQQAFQSYQKTMAGLDQQQAQPSGSPGSPSPDGPMGGAPQASSDPLAPYLDPRRIAANAAYGGLNAFMQGKDPNEVTERALKLQTDARASALKAAQLRSQQQGSPLLTTESFANNPQAGKALLRPENSNVMAHWPSMAAKWGYNPQDLSDINVQMVATNEANEQRRQLEMPLLPMPVGYKNLYGANGQLVQQQIGGETPGKESEVTGQKLPTFALEKSWNPALGRNQGMMLQTSPGGAPAPGAPGGRSGVSSVPGAAGGLGRQASAPIDLGYDKPSDPQLKAAMFGSEMRSGMNTLNKLEDSGFTLSAKTRTLLINAATSEDEGMIKQLFSQEALVHMSPKEQTYVAALMPMLQAAGHDQSGARLSTSQVRQNIESLLPIDVKNKEALAQVKENRQGFYNGLLTQAGAAAQLPQYKNSLGADLAQAQSKASGGKAPPTVGTVVKGHRFLGGDPSKQASWQKI